MKKRLISLIALLLAVLIPFGSLATTTVATAHPLTFDTTTLYGDSISSSIFKKYDLILVNFWAEWCGPCVSELPALEKIYQNYKKVLVIGVYLDSNVSGAISTAEDAGVTYPLIRLDSSMYQYLTISSGGSFSIPQTCFFNSKGYQLNEAYVGGRSYGAWATVVDELLEFVTAQPTDPDPDPTDTPEPDPTATPEPDPTATPDPDPTAGPDADPTAGPDADPTAAPDADPTAAPSAAPTIKTQPKNVTVKNGKKAVFKVKAEGENLKYQWYYRTSSTAKWKKVSSGGKSAVLTFKAKAKQNGYQYRCLVKNSAGKVYTKTVKLKVKK